MNAQQHDRAVLQITPRALVTWRVLVLWLVVLQVTCCLFAQETTPARPVRQAVATGVKLLERSARQYPQHRQCFACHHQTFPLLAGNAARTAGIEVDPKLPEEISEFTRTYLRGRLTSIKSGQGIPGRAFMTSYAAWTLRLGVEAQSDPHRVRETEAANEEFDRAFITYLVKTQEADGHWKPPSIRPPLEESLITGTVLARSHLRRWQSRLLDAAERAAVVEALTRSSSWLATAKLERTEDVVFRLWGLVDETAPSETIADMKAMLVKWQRDDGGWAQQPGMTSDAYATGQALFMLLTSGMSPQDEPLVKATAYLLKTQATDGSWFVQTRAKPIQEFFDNGDPYDKSQFISISATGWAVAALARTIQP